MDDEQDQQEVSDTEGTVKSQDPFFKTKTALGLLLGILSSIVVLLAIFLQYSVEKNNQLQTNLEPPCPSDRYTGWFCNLPRCEPGCHKGTCVLPNTCNCDDGWTGKLCTKATCEMPCTSHGKCTAPNTCTCESGWHGITCELPYAPGFQLNNVYVYSTTFSYAMKSSIKTNADDLTKQIEVWNFLSDVNITFSIIAVSKENNASLCVLRILDAKCSSDYKNRSQSTFNKYDCNQDAAKSLTQIKISFSQNLTTGKILKVFYKYSTEPEAIFVARILRFIDCQISLWDENENKVSFEDGKQITVSRFSSKSKLGMNCYNFNRKVKENMNTDREVKKVCLEKNGSPEYITLSEVFNIGQNNNHENSPVDAEDRDLMSLPPYRGKVIALGSLKSMEQVASSIAEKELQNLQNLQTAKDTITSDIEELAFRSIPLHDEYKDSNFFDEIDKIFNHPVPNQRLSLGIDLIRRSKSAFSVLKEMILTPVTLDLDSRSLLIAMLGASDERGGEKLLLDILEANEKIKGDHYLALGAITQLSKVSEDMVHVIGRTMHNTLDEDVKIRSILVFGALGSMGLQHKIIPVLHENLIKKDVTHGEKCAYIFALGNTHSESAFKPLARLITNNETYYDILSMRALKSIPGKQTYEFILQRLLNTRNKNEALQCLETLAHKGKWITPLDIDKIICIVHESKDNDVLSALKKMLVDLQTQCVNKDCLNYYGQKIDLGKFDSKFDVFEVKKESQNVGVYLKLTADANIEKWQPRFGAKTTLDVMVYGNRVTLLTAESINWMNGTHFQSTAIMTLHIFGKEKVLFSKTWTRGFGRDLSEENQCVAKHGNIAYSKTETFKFASFRFAYGIAGLADVNIKVDLSSSVSFGYGFNVIQNGSFRHLRQVGAVVKPEAKATASFSLNVNAAIVEAGIQGELDVISGSIPAYVALNLHSRKSCRFLSIDVAFLQGRVYVVGKIGFWRFSKRFKKQLFSWGGIKFSKTVTETYCCHHFLPNCPDLLAPCSTKSSISRPDKKIADALSFFNAKFMCYHTHMPEQCPRDLIDQLIQKGVHMFNYTISIALFEENDVFSKLHILPMLTTGGGDLYGLNDKGDVVQFNEIGQYIILSGSPADILADLAYEMKNNELSSASHDKEYFIYPTPNEFDLQFITKILDLRPFCSGMRNVCANIKQGIKHHKDVMIFTDIPTILEANTKKACSAYVQAQKTRYPYYCDAYPFSFSLQGGTGATVLTAHMKERDVKIKAIKDFIVDSGIKAGDTFVVLV